MDKLYYQKIFLLLHLNTFLHKNFSPDNDLRLKIVENNWKIKNYKEIFLFV